MPEELVNCKGLLNLSLSNNQIKDIKSITDQLGKLDSLTWENNPLPKEQFEAFDIQFYDDYDDYP